MPETPIEGGLQAAQRLRKEICAMDVVFKNNTIPFTMSFGVAALLPEQEVAKDGFIKMADDALILAKKSGKNQCFATKAENDATK